MRSHTPRAFFAGLMATMLLASIATAETPRPPEATGAIEAGEPRLTARLWTDRGDEGRWRLGVELEPAPGWHVYWRNAGDTGLPPKIRWGAVPEAPEARFGDIAWPAPRAFYDEEIDLLSYGYERSVLLQIDAQLPADTRTIVADVDALVCAHVCLPASFALSAPLAEAAPAVSARFEAERTRLPLRPEAVGVDVRWTEPPTRTAGDALRARLEILPCGDATDCDWSASTERFAFFPYASDAADWRADPVRGRPELGAGAFELALVGTALEDGDAAGPIAGVVGLIDAEGESRAVEIGRAPPATRITPATAAASPEVGGGIGIWLRALVFGWIGGLILNLMPCVLPVLAIKLAGLAQLAQGSRAEHRRHAAAYTAGIAASMLALASVVLAMRAAGHAVGWGFQLQEPAFLVGIACLLVAFALNLFGGFEILVDTSKLASVGSDAPGAMRSFFDGLLAVALATPCSAPFLGTAVGFAFASSAPVIVTVFLAIGLGLASPFLLAAAFPGWARKMPRSGPWMDDLRGVLGFALLGTVVWLLWILGRTSGPDAVIATLTLLVAVALVGFVLGLFQRRGASVSAALFAVVLVAVSGAGIGIIDFTPSDASEPRPAAIEAALPYSEDAVATSLAAGRPVFVYFTADWCVTCKVNEKGVLADPALGKELARLGYDVYRADWTRRDERIRSALADLGKAGVPVYALYAPGAPDRPRLLPELLTRDGLQSALREVAPSSNRS